MKRILLPLFLAVLAGLGCAIFMIRVVNSTKKVEVVEETAAVVVAAEALDATQEIQEGMLRVKRLPTSLVPADHYQDAKELIGRVLRTPVPADYPITTACLQPQGTLAGFDSKIPQGYRASTIKVDKWSSVSGFVFPGSRVDVIAQVLDPVTRKKRSRTILQNVEVAAVGSATSRAALSSDRQGGKTPHVDTQAVTLFLTPREVEILHDANAGRLTLALRSGADDSVREEPQSPPLVNVPRPQPPKAPRPKPEVQKPQKFVTWEIHGDQVREVTYVLIDGVWQRQNSEQSYPGTQAPQPVVALPMLKTNPAPVAGNVKNSAADAEEQDDTQEEADADEIIDEEVDESADDIDT